MYITKVYCMSILGKWHSCVHQHIPLVHRKAVRPCSAAAASATSKKKHKEGSTSLIDTSQEMPKTYPVVEVEQRWYPYWEENGFFRGRQRASTKEQGKKPSDSEDPFVLMLPPPNVTGSLHLGHALTVSLQDALARWHGMNGREVVWVPGVDHAGIATQVVLEKHLAATIGLTRHQLGREKFVAAAYQWKDAKERRIYGQLRKLGASLDWSRAMFTMDKNMSQAVVEACVRLHEAGLMYRALRPVHCCPALASVIADLEVEHEQLSGPTALTLPGYDEPVMFGLMYDIAYPLLPQESTNGSHSSATQPQEYIIVSTTRPETIPGDTAVMVHPEDPRYRELVGRRVENIFRPGQGGIPVVADEAVDRNKGTGAVKVTPAHSAVDLSVARRHDLPLLHLFNDDGTFNNTVPSLQGLARFKGREVILAALQERGLLKGTRPHAMTVPRCSRTRDVLELVLKPQWFVSLAAMARRSGEAVESGALDLRPVSARHTWKHWMTLAAKGDDWCVSRQIWWGHRLPLYKVVVVVEGGGGGRCGDGGAVVEVKGGDHRQEVEELWVAAASEEEAKEKGAKKLGVSAATVSVWQDEDVLDTWFSSALVPFAAFGWPAKSEDLDRYYPTSLLVTGHDILFFWVARMVMLGQQLTGQLPFKAVQLHGLVCDEDGHKMSKSRGNVVDPMVLVHGEQQDAQAVDATAATPLKGDAQLHGSATQQHIGPDSQNSGVRKAGEKSGVHRTTSLPLIGADTLRFSLLSQNISSEQVEFGSLAVAQHRTLANKVWQSIRFLRHGVACTHCQVLPLDHYTMEQLPVMERWMLHHSHGLAAAAYTAFTDRRINGLTSAFTSYWKTLLCGTYLETVKSHIYSAQTTTSPPSTQVPPSPPQQDQQGSAALVSLSVLRHCMQVGLLCVAPVMPFLAEECYHWLPPVQERTEKESIMLEGYPTPEMLSCHEDPVLAGQVGAWLRVVDALRSLRVNAGMRSGHAHGVVVSSDCNLSAAETSSEMNAVATYLTNYAHVDFVPHQIQYQSALPHQTNQSLQSHQPQESLESQSQNTNKVLDLPGPSSPTLFSSVDEQTVVHLHIEAADCKQQRERLENKSRKLDKQIKRTAKYERGNLEKMEKLERELQQIERMLTSLRERDYQSGS